MKNKLWIIILVIGVILITVGLILWPSLSNDKGGKSTDKNENKSHLNEVHEKDGFEITSMKINKVNDGNDYGEASNYEFVLSVKNNTGSDIPIGKLDFRLKYDDDRFYENLAYLNDLKNGASTKVKFNAVLSDINFIDYDFDLTVPEDENDMGAMAK